jgi:hypothetical protein
MFIDSSRLSVALTRSAGSYNCGRGCSACVVAVTTANAAAASNRSSYPGTVR